GTQDQTSEVHRAVDAALKLVNQQMSTYIADSELSLFNASARTDAVTVSSDLFNVLRLSRDIGEKTQGAFDVTVGPLVNLWGFGPQGRIEKAPNEEVIEDAINKIGLNQYALDNDKSTIQKMRADLYIDLSAVAKGFGVDQVASVLESFGIKGYLVEIGGELRAQGTKPEGESWLIAIESPDSTSRSVQKIIQVNDIAIATSGDYRNYFEEEGVRFSHTIDPSTGKPITHNLASVSVLMPTCAEADALATAFMVLGTEAAYSYALEHGIEAAFIYKSGSGFKELVTPGFSKYLVK
ncbi:MAG: FAD:protein FMN transferase, partial [Pontibacterium sp.]